MSLVLLFVGVLVAFFWLRRRRSRRLDVRAGLSGERPTFTVEPPTRSLIQHNEHGW